jgi:hypothetical protein
VQLKKRDEMAESGAVKFSWEVEGARAGGKQLDAPPAAVTAAAVQRPDAPPPAPVAAATSTSAATALGERSTIGRFPLEPPAGARPPAYRPGLAERPKAAPRSLHAPQTAAPALREADRGPAVRTPRFAGPPASGGAAAQQPTKWSWDIDRESRNWDLGKKALGSAENRRARVPPSARGASTL